MTFVPPTPSQRLTDAFHWIVLERDRTKVALGQLIDQAQSRFSLTPTEVIWVRWSLDPKSVAVASKEPDAR